jgi:hypothetical protein
MNAHTPLQKTVDALAVAGGRLATALGREWPGQELECTCGLVMTREQVDQCRVPNPDGQYVCTEFWAGAKSFDIECPECLAKNSFEDY